MYFELRWVLLIQTNGIDPDWRNKGAAFVKMEKLTKCIGESWSSVQRLSVAQDCFGERL
jgi:hypothetical protein